MEYPGQELEIFDKATIWRKYISILTKKYFKNDFLEVGAGIGSFTSNYYKNIKNIVLTELDEKNIKILKDKYSADKNITIQNKKISEINEKFNTIIYLNVLEHIKEDTLEIRSALDKLNLGGCLIILVPAHQELYGKFDEAVGHYKRYNIDYFKFSKFENAKIEKLIYLDLFGYLLYFLNKLFFKDEVYPSKFKIFLWDKIFSPITFFLDYLTRYKFGKNILCVYKKI